MHRCPTFRHRLPAALTALGMLLAPLPVLAQEQAPQTTSLIARLFPMPAVRGKIHFTAGLGTVELNGKPIHTAPGLRILNTSKQLVMLETLHGQTHTVNYVIEPNTGLLHTVWILSKAEADQPPKNAGAPQPR